jgi:hypothetical protein
VAPYKLIPEVTAALLCQNQIIDFQSKLRTLVNVASDFFLLQLPGPLQLALYIKLVDGEGEYQLRLRLVQMKDDTVLLDLPKQSISWPSGAAHVEIGLNLVQQEIKDEGSYEFQIFVDDVYVGRAPFKVTKAILQTQPE